MARVKTEDNLSVLHEKAKPVSYVSTPANPEQIALHTKVSSEIESVKFSAYHFIKQEISIFTNYIPPFLMLASCRDY